MRIGFIDTSGFDFNADTPHQRPLGGAHSAAAYLGEALAAAGHEIWLVSATTSPGPIRGVTCLSTHTFSPAQLPELDLDVCIALASATAGLKVRDHLAPKTAVVLWSGHAADQPAVARLGEPLVSGVYDGIALVSDWQREQYIAAFRLPPDRLRVMRNAPA